MTGRTILRGIVALSVMIMPAAARAQSAATGSIAGVVRDTTMAVLPGVTVEAASDALIEKVRTVVSDAQGQVQDRGFAPWHLHCHVLVDGFQRD